MRDYPFEVYQAAITENFPELACHTFEHLAHGKDHVVCRLNGKLLFRFPKRDEAEAKLRTEIRLLPELAPTLPLPIPRFHYVVLAPSTAFARAFVGYEELGGEPLTRYTPQIWDEAWWPPAVGAFLTALQRFPSRRAQELGVPGGTASDWRRQYSALYERIQERVYGLITSPQRAAIGRYFEHFLNEPRHFEFEPVLLHGDVYSQHILVDHAQQRVTGIIDFSECKIGDPAFDIRNSWEPFYSGQRDASWQERREFYYLLQPLLEVALSDGTAGLEEVNPTICADALAQLAQTWPPIAADRA